MGRVGKKQKKIHANKKGLKKIHASDLFKMREDIFLKKHSYTADSLEKNANIKNLHPPPPSLF
jgi:hypothetical protein